MQEFLTHIRQESQPLKTEDHDTVRRPDPVEHPVRAGFFQLIQDMKYKHSFAVHLGEGALDPRTVRNGWAARRHLQVKVVNAVSGRLHLIIDGLSDGEKMAKSSYAHAVDRIQDTLRPLLKVRGFKARGRTFNRVTEDGLTQVVSIQMGAADPPGTTAIPGLRENLHGLFAINLGVHVPEVARYQGGVQDLSWIQEYHCCVRARLGETSEESRDIWWHARSDDAVVDDVRRCLELEGLPFLDRFASRDKILMEWNGRSENMGASDPPRIVMAIILAERCQKDAARALLAQQLFEMRSPGHPGYVRGLASKLAVGSLDG